MLARPEYPTEYSEYPTEYSEYPTENSERLQPAVPVGCATTTAGSGGRFLRRELLRIYAAATRPTSALGRGGPGGIAWADAEKAKLADLNWQVGVSAQGGLNRALILRVPPGESAVIDATVVPRMVLQGPCSVGKGGEFVCLFLCSLFVLFGSSIARSFVCWFVRLCVVCRSSSKSLKH